MSNPAATLDWKVASFVPSNAARRMCDSARAQVFLFQALSPAMALHAILLIALSVNFAEKVLSSYRVEMPIFQYISHLPC